MRDYCFSVLDSNIPIKINSFKKCYPNISNKDLQILLNIIERDGTNRSFRCIDRIKSLYSSYKPYVVVTNPTYSKVYYFSEDEIGAYVVYNKTPEFINSMEYVKYKLSSIELEYKKIYCAGIYRFVSSCIPVYICIIEDKNAECYNSVSYDMLETHYLNFTYISQCILTDIIKPLRDKKIKNGN